MKIRIKGSSIRLRLSRYEVASLDNTGYLEEETLFLNNRFVYALQSVEKALGLSASFDNGKITVIISKALIKDWPINDSIGFDTTMQLTGTDTLYLLVEKDFTCLEETNEDQCDNYVNPNKAC